MRPFFKITAISLNLITVLYSATIVIRIWFRDRYFRYKMFRFLWVTCPPFVKMAVASINVRLICGNETVSRNLQVTKKLQMKLRMWLRYVMPEIRLCIQFIHLLCALS